MWKFGLIGKSLGHSFSKPYHNARFENESLDATYDNYELADASEVRRLFENTPELIGVNVTIPFKSEVLPFLDHVDDPAREMVAVNTIVRDGSRLVGYNTDIYGFEVSLMRFVTRPPARALVLGTGGAAKAVGHVLGKLKTEFEYVSRSPGSKVLTYREITPEMMALHTLIVNCTPLGMEPDASTLPDVPYHAMTDKHFVFDLVYNPRKTLFLKKSEEQGASVKNGLEMLHLQADRSWEIWQSYLDNENE